MASSSQFEGDLMTRQSLGATEDLVITVISVEVGNSDRLERAFTHNDNAEKLAGYSSCLYLS